MNSEAFKTYASEVIERHFKDAPAPNGTTETNLEHVRRKDSACEEIRSKLSESGLSESEQAELNKQAEKLAQAAIYDLFPKPKRKPKRYK